MTDREAIEEAVQPLLCAIGDLLEDLVVTCAVPPIRGADVGARITRHRGGSAANVAAAVARVGGRARFVGRIGADEIGDRLLAELQALGVDCRTARGGRTGTVVAVVEPGGERTLYSDRGAAGDLEHCDERWLDDANVLHVPYYSLSSDPMGRSPASSSRSHALARFSFNRRFVRRPARPPVRGAGLGLRT
ncbi:MAG: PfkB family carbohydrate kinase [Actinomycetota bacterium]